MDNSEPAHGRQEKSQFAQAALRYATNHAWPVFPITPGRKSPPLLPAWPEHACDVRSTIHEWWTRWPRANIGLHCRGLLVLDVDQRKNGRAALDSLIAQFGRLPPTVVSRTPQGWHVFFQCFARVGNSAGQLGAGLDVRARLGYVVLPPSTRPDGAYRWARGHAPDEIDLAAAPEWLVKLLQPPETPPRAPRAPPEATDSLAAYALAHDLEAVRTAPEGERNHTLYCKARALSRFEIPRPDLVDDLLAAALTAGLSQSEALATISSAMRHRSAS